MSIFSDVQHLYGGLHSVWQKSQAHVFSHLGLALVVFGICGATLPVPALPSVRADRIMEDKWFQLAKDVGVVYVAFLVPVILIVVYAAVLRILGQLLLTITMLVFPPRADRSRYRLLNSWILEPLALLAAKEDFELGDLFEKASQFAEKYQSRRRDEWRAYEESLASTSRNTTIYLSDVLVFLAGWIMLYSLAPRSPFVAANPDRFWPVTLTVTAFGWLLWFRVSRAVAAIPALRLLAVCAAVRADPEMAGVMKAPEDVRDRVRSRIDKLLGDHARWLDQKPSLLRYLASRLGFPDRTTSDSSKGRRVWGRPFPSLYERGSRFSWDEESNRKYDQAWLRGYGAYVYYRLHGRLTHLGKVVVELVRYLVTGVP